MGVTYQRWWCALCWLFSLDKSKDRFIKCWFTCIGRQESKTTCWKDLYVGLPAWDLDKLGKGWQEPHAVQQKEVQSSPPVKEQHHALLHAGSHWAGKQLRRKDPGGPGEHQVECEPAMCPYRKEGHQHPGLHQAEHCQQILPFCSALVRHVWSTVSCSGIPSTKDMNILERVQ